MIGSMWKRVTFDRWMLAEWAARDEQPILLTSSNPCITRAVGTQRVSGKFQINNNGYYKQQAQPTKALDTAVSRPLIG
jgi:hypothetical protein